MEVWEVASALGEATADLEEWHAEYSRLEREQEEVSDGLGVSSPAVKYGGTDLLAQRVAAAKGEAPEPEARVMSTLETADLMGRLNG
jgi:hypothetical protein